MKNLTPVLVMTVLMLWVGVGVSGAAEDILLQTSVTPEEAWVGQRVRLHVDVLGADGWAQITDMGEIEIPGTYVLSTESQGTRLNRTIRGTTYTGQRYELSLYCQRSGRVEIPAIPVTVTVKQWGAQPSEILHEATTPTAFLTCKVPPGAEGIRGLISTTHLAAGQSWSSEPDTVALGDAITRTVTLDADDVSGMAFPPMQHPPGEGMGLYAGEPSVVDETDRGALRGQRVETVTYVFEQPGEVALPDIVLPWWNIQSETLERIELPGLALVVASAPVPEGASTTVDEQPVRVRDRVYAVMGIAAFVVLGLWLGRTLTRRFRRWRKARSESEAAFFKRLGSTLRGGDPVAISGAALRWLDRLDTGTRPARLDLFLRNHGDEATRAAAGVLAQCLATGETFTESRELGRGLGHARKRLLRYRGRERKAARVLPELNGRLSSRSGTD